jgi:hypothetical protein
VQRRGIAPPSEKALDLSSMFTSVDPCPRAA